jgi:hypothetical protein
MNKCIVLLVGALFLFPAPAHAQNAQSPAPSAMPSAAPAATAAASPSAAPAASPAPTAPATVAPPVDTPSISIPPDWTATTYTSNMGGFTLMKMWYAPNKTGDNINLGYGPNPNSASLAQVVPQVRAVLQRMLGANNVTDHPEKLCGGSAKGWLFNGTITMGAFNMVVEEAILVSKHDVFGATYTRLKTHPEDKTARKAIDSLCAK